MEKTTTHFQLKMTAPVAGIAAALLTAIVIQGTRFPIPVIIAVGMLIPILFYFYIGRAVARMEETYLAQQIEILSRKFAEVQLIEAKGRAEDALAKLHQVQDKLQLHINQTPLGVIQWGPNMRVEAWNPAAEMIFGYTAAEAIGRSATDLIVPDDVFVHVEQIWQNLMTQTGGTNERHRNKTQDGRRIWCHWHNTPLVNASGRVVGASSIVQDVTKELQYEQDLQQAKEQAEAANRHKSAFLANMTHELRTPMNAILGFSDLLRTEPMTAEQLDYAETIYTSGQHLLSLINDVLDVSKIEAGKEEIVTAACSPRQLLGQLENMMRNTAERKGLCFEIEIQDDIPEQIVTDAKHLYQTLINLTGNAIKFTEQGSVSVRISLLDGIADTRLCFEVADTGIGVPADRQATIFASFEQADVDTSIRYGGTGLGLAISKKLIEMMGGTLTLDSTEGVGSTFTVILPFEPVNKSTAPQAAR